MAQRDERIHILLTAAERDILQQAADNMGLGISTYIRIKALEAARAK